jgi:hypothetical protein
MYVTSIRGRTGSDVLTVAPAQRTTGDVGKSGW